MRLRVLALAVAIATAIVTLITVRGRAQLLPVPLAQTTPSPPPPCFPFSARDENPFDCPLAEHLLGLSVVDDFGFPYYTASLPLDQAVEELKSQGSHRRLGDVLDLTHSPQALRSLTPLLRRLAVRREISAATRDFLDAERQVVRACKLIQVRAHGVSRALELYSARLSGLALDVIAAPPRPRRELLELHEHGLAKVRGTQRLAAQVEELSALTCDSVVAAQRVAGLADSVDPFSRTRRRPSGSWETPTLKSAQAFEAEVDVLEQELRADEAGIYESTSGLVEARALFRSKLYEQIDRSRELARAIQKQPDGTLRERELAAGLAEAIPLAQLVLGRTEAVVLANTRATEGCLLSEKEADRDECRARFQGTAQRWRARLDALQLIKASLSGLDE